MTVLEETTVICLHPSDIYFALLGTCVRELLVFDLVLFVYGHNESS